MVFVFVFHVAVCLFTFCVCQLFIFRLSFHYFLGIILPVFQDGRMFIAAPTVSNFSLVLSSSYNGLDYPIHNGLDLPVFHHLFKFFTS